MPYTALKEDALVSGCDGESVRISAALLKCDKRLSDLPCVGLDVDLRWQGVDVYAQGISGRAFERCVHEHLAAALKQVCVLVGYCQAEHVLGCGGAEGCFVQPEVAYLQAVCVYRAVQAAAKVAKCHVEVLCVDVVPLQFGSGDVSEYGAVSVCIYVEGGSVAYPEAREEECQQTFRVMESGSERAVRGRGSGCLLALGVEVSRDGAVQRVAAKSRRQCAQV